MSSREVLCDLRDGRKLSGLIIGDPALNKVILYFHGFPGSRYEAEIAKSQANALGICIVAFDRPGFGRSTHDSQRTVLSLGADIKEAVDQLGIDKFSVLGISGGTPYAISTALALQDRVEHLGVVSGVSQVDSPEALSGMNFANRCLLNLGKRSETLAVGICGLIARMWSFDKFVQLWFGMLLPKADKKILENKRLIGMLSRSYKEALSGGIEGAKQDFKLMLKPWGIDFSKIVAPVSIWHGLADSYVPPSMAQDLASRFQTAKLYMVEDQGHFVIAKIMDEVLTTITSISKVSEQPS